MKFEEFIKSYNELYKACNSIYHAYALSCGLSDSSLAILYELRTNENDVTQKDLGASLSLSKQTVNSSIKWLLDNGLVVFKDSKDDKRSKAVILTDEGKRFCADKIDRIIQAEEMAFGRLTEAEASALISSEKKYFQFFSEESNKVIGKKRYEKDSIIR